MWLSFLYQFKECSACKDFVGGEWSLFKYRLLLHVWNLHSNNKFCFCSAIGPKIAIIYTRIYARVPSSQRRKPLFRARAFRADPPHEQTPYGVLAASQTSLDSGDSQWQLAKLVDHLQAVGHWKCISRQCIKSFEAKRFEQTPSPSPPPTLPTDLV